MADVITCTICGFQADDIGDGHDHIEEEYQKLPPEQRVRLAEPGAYKVWVKEKFRPKPREFRPWIKRLFSKSIETGVGVSIDPRSD